MPIRANALAVMAKAPVAGSVKTRLVPPLTHQQAAELYRALLLDQLEHLTSLHIADLYVAFMPHDADTLMERLVPAVYQCFPQRGADLGQRMNEVFAELWRRGHRNAVLIGSDLPLVPLDTLHEVFTYLSPSDKRVVLGPSQDGGYYLVGMNQPVPEIFSDMTWSHNRVLAETIEKLARLDIDFHLARKWFDVDRIEDLQQLRAASDPSTRAAMKRTLACLEQLVGVGG
jgi:uncharacterized protein